MEIALSNAASWVIGVALVPIAFALCWAICWFTWLLPIRWFWSLASVISFACLLAIVFRALPEQAMPEGRSPWWLGVGVASFTAFAVLAWRRRGEPPSQPTEDMLTQRVREISGWLQEPMTLEGALDRLKEFDCPSANKPSESVGGQLLTLVLSIVTGLWVVTLYWRFRDGPRVPTCDRFERWYVERGRRGDELWWYHSGAESWEMLAGECGYAIRRDGTVVDIYMLFEN